MSNVQSESLGWLDKLAALNAQLVKIPSANNSALARALNYPRPTVVSLMAFREIFDPAALDKIRQAARGDSAYTLSFTSAEALIGLKGRVPAPPAAVHEA